MMVSHPFHVSITQMEYKEESKTVQISSKVFLDDLEASFNGYFDSDVDLWELREDSATDAQLREFFAYHFKVWINGKEQEVVYMGKEVDLDAAWIYLEIRKVRKIKELQVQYTIALQAFDDQVNLLHMKYQGQEESMRIDNGSKQATVSFEN